MKSVLPFLKSENVSRGHFRTKIMSFKRPFNVLKELVLEDGIHLLDWLPASIFENKLRTIESGMTRKNVQIN